MKQWHVIAINGWQIILDKMSFTANEATENMHRLEHAKAYSDLTKDQRVALEAEDRDSHLPGTLGYRMVNMTDYDLVKFLEDAEKLKGEGVSFKREYY
jgi:hypothetical protein